MITTLATALSLLLAGAQPAQAQIHQTGARSMPAASALDATDREIEEALFKLLRDDPQRVVCVEKARATPTRVGKPMCASVERWFNARPASDVESNRAPMQLVDQIKKSRRKAQLSGGARTPQAPS